MTSRHGHPALTFLFPIGASGNPLCFVEKGTVYEG
jgi:hypothetical protein